MSVIVLKSLEMMKEGSVEMIKIDLHGQVGLVTGGARGIGRAICRILAEAGASVWVNYVSSKAEAEHLCAQIEAKGGRATAVKADVTQPEQVKEMVDAMLEREEKVDILVNNAGITSVRSVLEMTTGEWERVLSVNLDGPFLCSKEILPHMVDRRRGTIVNISSTGAMTGGGGGVHYSASKSALDAMTRALAREFAPHGIRVNGLAPTMIDSDFLKERYPNAEVRTKLAAAVPLRRLGTPEDVAYMTAVLCTPFASYLSGETIVMDGGRTFA